MSKPSIAAFIPAKATSNRVPGKNKRLLSGHPLIAWTIAAAHESGIFKDIIVSTNSKDIAKISRDYDCTKIINRPRRFATDTSPDIKWVEHLLWSTSATGYDAFAILRPTSPFRTADTIVRAWEEFLEHEGIDSLRAVEKCYQHPYKMWRINGNGGSMEPLFEAPEGEIPWHSSQYQTLPEIWVQNASMEIAWTETVFNTNTIAGTKVIPFVTKEYEGFDINIEEDFRQAEGLIDRGEVTPPLQLTEDRFSNTLR